MGEIKKNNCGFILKNSVFKCVCALRDREEFG